jgi:Tfp pilus assembly protein PilX
MKTYYFSAHKKEACVFGLMKKAVVLLAVIGIMLVVSALALAVLTIMTQQSRLTENKIRRIRSFYAAQAGLVNATDRLIRNEAVVNPVNVGAANVPGYPVSVAVTRVAPNAADPYPFNESSTITANVTY